MSELAVGLMSGTSLDGVDAALVKIRGPTSTELVAFHLQPFSPRDREAVLQVVSGGTVRDVSLLHVALGRVFADAARAVIETAGLTADDVSFVASHGHTVWHEPGKASLQLGDAAIIAERVGTRVVSDFRCRDVAAGGQGAPLVPLADAMLFGSSEHGRVLLNLGGMANFTWVPRRGSLDGVIACDTGPGVAVIDAVTRQIDPAAKFDENGIRARRGTPATAIVDRLLEHPFFSAPPPKSTGRELFGEAYARELMALVKQSAPDATDDDLIATALQLTTRSIELHLARWVPGNHGIDLVVSGGGARNPVLVENLRASVTRTLRLFDDEFFDGDAKEAVAFAYLGWLTIQGLPGNIPSATGAQGPRVLGHVTPA